EFDARCRDGRHEFPVRRVRGDGFFSAELVDRNAGWPHDVVGKLVHSLLDAAFFVVEDLKSRQLHVGQLWSHRFNLRALNLLCHPRVPFIRPVFYRAAAIAEGRSRSGSGSCKLASSCRASLTPGAALKVRSPSFSLAKPANWASTMESNTSLMTWATAAVVAGGRLAMLRAKASMELLSSLRATARFAL